ncbi:MAG: L-threonylcarbamoyladenylate synthase [Flavobacteriales bacterium]|nr:L-threonylcarbamoyladenylate synthase [Flavobacteriales bacterium]MCX7649052.1 L-threonylcarbamoyladenylate synthase [Flavobacteriales bacterium]MDW8432225.1 L-threonylcarbamoyladenylate synthase [Flavobacteriales bacterium]
MARAVISRDIEEAVRLLKAGSVVALPTETVYGLAGNALIRDTVMRIFKIKGRPTFDPLIVHCKNAEDAFRYAVRIPSAAIRLAEKFWPGPLTLVLNSTRKIPSEVTAGLGTVGLRVPSHPLFHQVLEALDFPLAAPSANPFGYVSPTTARHVSDQLGHLIDFILDGGPCLYGMESTIVGFEKNVPVVYRLGALPLKKIRQVAPDVTVKIHASSNPKAPGQLSSHYAPSKKVLWANAAPSSVLEDRLTAVLVFGPSPEVKPHCHIMNLSSTGDYHEAARNLYRLLREFDAGPWHTLVIHPIPQDPEGWSDVLNDRLERAAAPR